MVGSQSEAPPRWGAQAPLAWRRASGDPAGPGSRAWEKSPIDTAAGGRQRGPVSSVWEREATTSGHEIVSSVPPGRDGVAREATGAQPEVAAAPPCPRPRPQSVGQTGVALRSPSPQPSAHLWGQGDGHPVRGEPMAPASPRPRGTVLGGCGPHTVCPELPRPRTGPEWGVGGAGSRRHFLMFAEGRVQKEDICSK